MLSKNALYEQRTLKFSMLATVVGATLSIVFGLWAASRSIVFDGFYELIDAVMTAMALLVVRLIARGNDERFQFGYWHLETIMALVNGSILLFACLYAFIDGLSGVLAGGRVVHFGLGALFVSVTGLGSFAMYLVTSKAARQTRSQLLNIDARSWLMGALLSLGLTISFACAWLLSHSAEAALTAYVDPAILMIVAVVLAPFPIRTVMRAGREILIIAPSELNREVHAIAETVAARHGFVDYSSYVRQFGRQQFIEIGFVAASGEETRSFAQLDAIRDEIAAGLGRRGPGYWLSVDFTADKNWL